MGTVATDVKKEESTANLLSSETKPVFQKVDEEKWEAKRIGLAYFEKVAWFSKADLDLPEEATYDEIYKIAQKKVGCTPLNTEKDLESFKLVGSQIKKITEGIYVIFFGEEEVQADDGKKEKKRYVIEAAVCYCGKIYYTKRLISAKICTRFLRIGFFG